MSEAADKARALLAECDADGAIEHAVALKRALDVVLAELSEAEASRDDLRKQREHWRATAEQLERENAFLRGGATADAREAERLKTTAAPRVALNVDAVRHDREEGDVF